MRLFRSFEKSQKLTRTYQTKKKERSMILMVSKDRAHQLFLVLTSKMLTIFLRDSSPLMDLIMKKEIFSVASSIEEKEEKQIRTVLFLLFSIMTIFSKVAFPLLRSRQADLEELPNRSARPHARCKCYMS